MGGRIFNPLQCSCEALYPEIGLGCKATVLPTVTNFNLNSPPPPSPLGCKLNLFLVFDLRNQEEKASTAQRNLLEADLEELPCLILVVVDSFSWKFRNHSGKWACLIFGEDISWSAHIADVGCFTLLSLTQEYASFYQTHSPIWRESSPVPSQPSFILLMAEYVVPVTYYFRWMALHLGFCFLASRRLAREKVALLECIWTDRLKSKFSF